MNCTLKRQKGTIRIYQLFLAFSQFLVDGRCGDDRVIKGLDFIVDDQISNFGNSSKEFSIAPAPMPFRVFANHFCKPDVLLTVESYAEEMINGVEVGFELLDEIDLLARQPVVVDNAL